VTTLVTPSAAVCFHTVRLIRRKTDVQKRLTRNIDLFLAVLADTTDEALSCDENHGTRDQKRLYAHIDQTGDCRRCVIGMKCRENEVSRQRSLDRYFSRLHVPN